MKDIESKLDVHSDVDGELPIKLVNSLNERSEFRLCLFDSLPRDGLYSLHIEYNLRGIEPVRVESGLDYEGLGREIAENLVSPSKSLMNIFVTSYKDSRHEGVLLCH